MSCGCDKPKPPRKTCEMPSPVLEIKNEECPILFHTVELEGTSQENPPYIGEYRNTLLVYKGDDTRFLFSSDGIPTSLAGGSSSGDMEFNLILNRPKYAEVEMTSSTSIPDVDTTAQAKVDALDETLATVAKTGAYVDLSGRPSLTAVATSGSYTDLINTPVVDTTFSDSSTNAIQNATVTGALDRGVVTDITLPDNPSTTVVDINEVKTNLCSGTSATTTISLPVASTTQAGVMNKATYDAVTNNANSINALLNGAVAVTGLAASPSQSDITTAWETETGLSTLINRASVYDVDNDKVWTYYTNDTTWHAASNTTQVTINTFTNSSEGIIKGSTTTGQVFAESDGTGSVNGWDTLSGQVSTNTSKLSTIAQGAEVNVQVNWNESDNTSDAYILNKPSLAAVATSGAYTDLSGTPSLATVATSGSYTDLSNKPTVPTITLSTTDIGEGATLAANTLYGVYS